MKSKTKKDETTVREIRSTTKQITILFTDIEDSTRFWDKHGDVEGRLMVDRHNRLLFPVIKKFRGKIIKTIGDSIMASFKKPEAAVTAAIAMQQILEKERLKDKQFKLKVRIGIHTGEAIVESKDVFGDVVNVAARIEGESAGSEILVSRITADLLDKKEYKLVRKGSFMPKGKKRQMALYQCEWEAYPWIADDIKMTSFLPVIPRQKIELLVYTFIFGFTIYFIYQKFLRFFFADSEQIALIFLNPKDLWSEYPWIIAIGILLVILIITLLLKMKTVPPFILKFLKGGFGFSAAFFLLYLPAQFMIPDIKPFWNNHIFQSDHLFVEVLADDVNIYEQAFFDSEILKSVDQGTLLLLSAVAKRGNLTWNKVLIGDGKFGWVLRVMPAQIGIPEERKTLANKFKFCYKHLYAFLLGIAGFLWGYFKFRIKPV